MKRYRVVLLLAFAVACLLAARANAATSIELSGGTRAQHEANAVRFWVNRERQEHGLASLRPNGELREAALVYARQLVADHVFEHADTMARVKNYGYRPIRTGEVLEWCSASTARSAVEAWMNSPEHRAVLLDPSFHEIGVGIAPRTPNGQDGVTLAADLGSAQRIRPIRR